MNSYEILTGDVRERLADIPDGSVRCCVTSPPYWGLRDYGHDGQIGLEQTPDEYVAEMVAVFREVRRVLADDGTLWLNIGDSYASFRDGKATPDTTRGDSTGTLVEKGKASNRSASNFAGTSIKHKDLVGIPWRLAFALQADGWWLRQDIIWHKPNPMPESVTDRCTKAHEYVFLLTKSAKYYYDHAAIAEASIHAGTTIKAYQSGKNQSGQAFRQTATGGHDVTVGETRNRRSVWSITTKPFKGAHFAVMPEALAEPCVLAGSAPGDLVLDPFTGSGTVAVVALRHGRRFIGTELNPEYVQIAQDRINTATAQGTLL
jgi:DNA modification methylase